MYASTQLLDLGVFNLRGLGLLNFEELGNLQ